MWYKLTLSQQFFFILIVGWPIWMWAFIHISRQISELFDDWMNGASYLSNDAHAAKTPLPQVKWGTGTTLPKEGIVNHIKRSASVTNLLAGEREVPPRAKFFGRLDGKPIDIDGEYAVELLNQFELRYWQSVCAQKSGIRAQDTEIGAKICKTAGFINIEEQNRQTAQKLGLIDGKNPENGYNNRITADKGYEIVIWNAALGKWFLDETIPVPHSYIKHYRNIDGRHLAEITYNQANVLRKAFAYNDPSEEVPIGFARVTWNDGKWLLDGIYEVDRSMVVANKMLSNGRKHIALIELSQATFVRNRANRNLEVEMDLTDSFTQNMRGY